MLPPCEGEYGILPEGIHECSLEEIEKRFVVEAPESTRDRRELVFDALTLHVKMLRRLFRGHPIRIWANGGFTTLKRKPPRDVDLYCIVPPEAYENVSKDAALPLWSLSNVTARRGGTGPEIVTEKLHTMGGLTDAYVERSDREYAIELMRREWTHVKGDDGKVVKGLVKGIVEVRFDG